MFKRASQFGKHRNLLSAGVYRLAPNNGTYQKGKKTETSKKKGRSQISALSAAQQESLARIARIRVFIQQVSVFENSAPEKKLRMAAAIVRAAEKIERKLKEFSSSGPLEREYADRFVSCRSAVNSARLMMLGQTGSIKTSR